VSYIANNVGTYHSNERCIESSQRFSGSLRLEVEAMGSMER
jgi:hypothetical protein